MNLTPGERAVLGQIRVLYSTAARRDQPVKALTMQWTPTHYETYRAAYAMLVGKRLIEDAGAQSFMITDAGLLAIGVVPTRPQPQLPPKAQRPAAKLDSQKPAAAQPRGALARLVSGLLRSRAN